MRTPPAPPTRTFPLELELELELELLMNAEHSRASSWSSDRWSTPLRMSVTARVVSPVVMNCLKLVVVEVLALDEDVEGSGVIEDI